MRMLLKKMLQTVLFYAVSFVILYFIFKVDRGGPCAPPLGMMLALFLFFPLCIFLFAWNFYLFVKKGKDHLPSMIIHGLVIATLCVGVAVG